MAKANQPGLITVINSFRAVLDRPDEQMRRAWHVHVNNQWKRHNYRTAYPFTHRLTPLTPSNPLTK